MEPLVVVMGVSGSGKSTVGEALAQRLGVAFEDGDDLHPASNVAKMASGHPLDDHDREPWLDDVGAWLTGRGEAGGVIACSALKRAYRDRIRGHAPAVRFVELIGGRDLIATRQRERTGHFMPPALLSSQLSDLEPLQPDEHGIGVDVLDPVDVVVEHVVGALARE